MAEDKAQIVFNNVSFTYDIPDDTSDAPFNPVYAVSNADFSVKKGEFVCIVGRNGSGKSTIARLSNALLLPSSGTVFVDEISTENDELLWEIHSRVGMVFQNPDNQIIGASVDEDVAFGLENLGVPRPEMLERIAWAEATAGIAAQAEADPQTLSGGQKQRVAIAGILAMKPECIVLDEATAMLDPVGRHEVMDVIRKLNRESGITILHITHHMDEVCMCDRAILVKDSQIIADMTPRQLFSDEALVKSAGLEVPKVTELMNILRPKFPDIIPAGIISVDEALPVLTKLLENASGTELAANERQQKREQRRHKYVFHEGEGSIKAENISYTYNKKTPYAKHALQNVSFSVGDGEIIGIIGHTGCGKSTLVQHLNGLLSPDEGTCYVGGVPLTGASAKEARRKVGLVFQYPEYQLFESTVEADIAFGLKAEKLSEEDTKLRVREAAQAVGLSEDLLDNSIYELSGGQKRRAAIAGVLVMRPRIMVLDEPAAGLDPAGREDILRLCKDLRDTKGITVIIVSHSMDDVAKLCDRILVMNKRSVYTCGLPEDVFLHEEELKKIGLDVPSLSSLFSKLGKLVPEAHISDRIFTPEDGAEEILALLGKECEA